MILIITSTVNITPRYTQLQVTQLGMDFMDIRAWAKLNIIWKQIFSARMIYIIRTAYLQRESRLDMSSIWNSLLLFGDYNFRFAASFDYSYLPPTKYTACPQNCWAAVAGGSSNHHLKFHNLCFRESRSLSSVTRMYVRCKLSMEDLMGVM
jgi:hypothetical protein